MDHYDVIVIGSGAGGGTLTWSLAPSTAMNPTLTIIANALRVGDHLARRLS